MLAEDQQISARKMEVYAAMADKIDHNIGKVLDYLDASGERDSTFVVFMPGNCLERSLLESQPLLGNMSMADLLLGPC